MQNNEIQTLLQGQYAKLLIYFDLGLGQIRRIRGVYEVAQNVICSSSMCDEYHKIEISYVHHMFLSISHWCQPMYILWLLCIDLTSSPLWRAGQLLIAKLPEMKSFWTSTMINAETGRTTFKLKSNLKHILSPI